MSDDQKAAEDKDGKKNDGKDGKEDRQEGGKGGSQDSSTGNEKEGDKDGAKPQGPKSKLPLFILAGVVLIAAIVAFFVWFAKRNQVTTDDAYTDGNSITVAPKVAGYVTELNINDNSFVRAGDLLLRIDPRDYLASQAQAQAQLADAKAQLESARVAYDIARVQYPAQLAAANAQVRSAQASYAQAQASYQRQHGVDPRATTQENIDVSNSQAVSSASSVASAKAQADVARLVPEQLRAAAATVMQREASVQEAEAQVNQANLNLAYTELRAPADGFITKRNVQLGSYLAVGSTLFFLVTRDIWITANFKESQLGRMRPGNRVDIEVDAYSGLKLQGHVQSIQQGSGSRFSTFPVENATGNYVKIVQRVPVKIVIDNGLDPRAPLPMGLSVDPVVYLQ